MTDAGLVKEAALIETILYMQGEPLDEAALSEISGLAHDVVGQALEQLDARYAAEESGLELSRSGGKIQISPKKIYWDNLREKYGKKSDGRRSKAALETLTIIAYKQPITRAEVEAIRGVQVDTMIRLLEKENLIRVISKKDAPGKPAQYGTTPNFLKVFDLGSIADLPKLDASEAERFELQGDF
ncbi:MAG: SMC-Scp complex subunit ScpB [Treponema sp.]|nr:SMC-Scp complex subunit ScpB [Treponema sp.]